MDFSEPFFWTRSHFLNRKNGVEMAKNGFKHALWPARTVFAGRCVAKNGSMFLWVYLRKRLSGPFFWPKTCKTPRDFTHVKLRILFSLFYQKNGFERKNSRSEPIFGRHFFQAIYLRKGYAQLRGHVFGRFLPFRSHFFHFRSHFFISQMALKMASWLFCPCKI